jgi:predicted ATPase
MEHGAVVLVLDDCHWLDAGSAALLEYVVESCAALPVCVLLAARPGAVADNPQLLRVLRALRRRALLTELSLAPFTPEETAELLRSVASPADPARVHGASGGNALFALELSRVPTLQQADVPLSIARLVRDRISMLSAEVADVLRWASVLGTSFDQRLLERIVALDPEGFVSGLEHLERHGYLRFEGSAVGCAARSASIRTCRAAHGRSCTRCA